MYMTPPLDVLFVITKASWGGAQRYVHDLATALAAEGREVAVAYGTPGLLVERLASAGIRTIPLSSMGRDIRVGSEVSSFFALRSLFRTLRPRVVHLNSSKAGGLGSLAARLAGVPRIVFTAHGWAWNEDRPFPARFAIRVFAWLTVMLAHRTICVSDAMRREASWMPFAASKLVVVANAIEAPAFLARADARERLGLPASGAVIGMISELHPTKRVEDAIRAASMLVERHPGITLAVLGDGEERLELERLIALHGLTDRVRLLGFVPDASRYLKAFDLFLHASRSESFGFAVVEAGFAGLPVVATNVGAIPELIEHAVSGTLVRSQDPEALARALSRYIEHPEKAKEHGDALSLRMREIVSLPRMVRETAALYEPTNS